MASTAKLDVPNLYVIKLCNSLKSREYVTENFCWNHYYYYLTNEGIQYLREYLHLPVEIVPATLKKRAPATRAAAPQGGPRDGPQGGGGGAGRGRMGQRKDAGPDSSFHPTFAGRGAAPASSAPTEGNADGW